MNANVQTWMTYAQALGLGQNKEEQVQQNKELIAGVRALAQGKGMVWSEMTEDEITELIVEHELNKEVQAEAVQEEKEKKEPINLCLNCGIDMGDDNPRQLCQKSFCPNEEGEFLEKKQEEEEEEEEEKEEKEKEKEKELVPQIMLGSAEQVLDHIARLTGRFSLLDPHFTYWLMMRIGGRPVTTFGYLPAPLKPGACKQVIGKDGCYFKMTTMNTGADFIWHDRTENHFLFWGPQASVIEAMKIIQGRIHNLQPNL
jgi:hypothetical protein